MGIPFFQQQSAAYNTHQKNRLHLFTPDGRHYQVDPGGKSYADYADEVQEYLVPFEVEALLAQRDSLRDALTRRYLIQHFGLGGDEHFAGMDMDNVTAELQQRSITPGAIKSALRSTAARVTAEIKDTWPIRESGRNLQYTSYDIVFSAIEVKTPAKRQKIWDVVAAWASASKLPGKEGARLATVQEWDERDGNAAIRVDLHHYPRPDLDSCRAITLLDAPERNKDLDILRKALARIGVELSDLAVKPYAATHHAAPPSAAARGAQPPAVAPEIDESEPLMPLTPPLSATRPEPTLADTLAAVRFERDRLDQQLHLLSNALTDHDERKRQALRIESLEASLEQCERTLHALTPELRETRKSRDHWKSRAETVETAIREEMLKQHDAAQLAQEIEFTRQIQGLQQEHRREVQQLRDNHMRQLEELQDTYLKQIQKLRRLMPVQDILHVEEESPEAPPLTMPPLSIPPSRTSIASKLDQYQAESQEIFDTRIGEYLRIAKDQGLSQADDWLLAEAKKLAEARSKQGELGL